MNTKDYIASGILELYVAGSLSEKKNEEVHNAILENPELLAEVKSIEDAIVQLTAFAKKDEAYSFHDIKDQLTDNEPKVIPLIKTKPSWKIGIGWAAAIFFGTTLILFVLQNNKLKEQLASGNIEKETLEAKIDSASTSLAAAEKLLKVFRDKDIVSVPLKGQTASPTSYAKVYWDKKTKAIYLDAKGLPEPPNGKVYQVWSLKMSPLTPTSLGTLDAFTADANKIFTIKNTNDSEAFGITLEPLGGSSSPTLTQLYTLGAVSS